MMDATVSAVATIAMLPNTLSVPAADRAAIVSKRVDDTLSDRASTSTSVLAVVLSTRRDKASAKWN